MKRKNAALPLLLIILITILCSCSAKKTYVAPTYEEHQLILAGFWAPDPTEEAYLLYKDAGLNTLLQINHGAKYLYDEDGNFNMTTENAYFLGSELSFKSLELCKKVGLDAILGYGGWFGCENYPSDRKVFSARNVYGEYADIIKGIDIADEPFKQYIDYYGDSTFVEDFKSVYPDLPFMINLNPSLTMQDSNYFGMGSGATYEEYVEYYSEKIVKQFDSMQYMSVDVYPFEQRGSDKYLASGWLYCYETIANYAVAYDADRLNYYIQTVWGGENGLRNPRLVTADEIRLQVYMSLAYGANSISYYCYSMPTDLENGQWSGMYEYCMLDIDGNPTPIYDSVRQVNAEVTAFDDALLSYDYVKTYPIFKDGESKSRTDFAYLSNRIEDASLKRIESITADNETVVGVFEDDDGEQAFMFVNYSDPSENVTSTVRLRLDDCGAVAVYGGIGFSGEPEIIYAENDQITLTLDKGEGLFVVPLF